MANIQIVEYQASLFDTSNNWSEVVAEKNHIGSLFRYVTACYAHGNTWTMVTSNLNVLFVWIEALMPIQTYRYQLFSKLANRQHQHQ